MYLCAVKQIELLQIFVSLQALRIHSVHVLYYMYIVLQTVECALPVCTISLIITEYFFPRSPKFLLQVFYRFSLQSYIGKSIHSYSFNTTGLSNKTYHTFTNTSYSTPFTPIWIQRMNQLGACQKPCVRLSTGGLMYETLLSPCIGDQLYY